MKSKFLKLNMQFFAESGNDADTNDTGDTNNTADKGDSGSSANNTTAELDKLVQARADKLTAEMGKKNAALQKELDKLKKEKMTADELKAHEISEKEKTLAEREKMLADKENRLLAIKAIKKAGLDDGSDKALELVDFVMGEDEETINNKVNVFGELVKKFVAAEVDKAFKKNGRNPNSGNNGSGDDNKGKSTVAEQLGKARADKQKKSNDILKLYTGGR